MDVAGTDPVTPPAISRGITDVTIGPVRFRGHRSVARSVADLPGDGPTDRRRRPARAAPIEDENDGTPQHRSYHWHGTHRHHDHHHHHGSEINHRATPTTIQHRDVNSLQHRDVHPIQHRGGTPVRRRRHGGRSHSRPNGAWRHSKPVTTLPTSFDRFILASAQPSGAPFRPRCHRSRRYGTANRR